MVKYKYIIIIFLFFHGFKVAAQNQISVLAGTSGMKGLAMSLSFEKPIKTNIDTLNETVNKSVEIFICGLNYENQYLHGDKFNSIQFNTGAKIKVINDDKNAEDHKRKIDLFAGLQFYGKHAFDKILLNNKNISAFSFGIKPLIEAGYLITPRTSLIIKYEQDLVLINKDFGNDYYLFTGIKLKF